MNEKRQNIRWRINRKVSLDLAGAGLASGGCLLGDIGMGGVRISSPQRLPAEGSLNINLALTENIVLENLQATVAWRRETGDINTYGLCFREIEGIDKDRICAFVYHNFPEKTKEPPWMKR